jgi:hypothetical protein
VDLIQIADGVYYVVMEFVAGQELGMLLKA